MSGIDVSGIISGFDEARRYERDAAMKLAHSREDRDFSILSALAQHMDPEIAAVGASALLGLQGSAGPKMRKGFSGFMGEIEKSSALEPLKRFLGAGSMNAMPTPGSAAQPSTALIEPEAQGVNARATAPTFGGNPAEEQVGARVAPPQFGGASAPASAVGGTLPPEFGGGGAGPAGGPLGMAPPPGPPPPETPQARMKRLFPSAGDIAEETKFRELKGRLNFLMEAIQRAKTDDERDLVRGIAGAPRSRAVTKPLNAEFRTADGQEMTGTVIFDQQSGQAEVDGQAVTILKMLPTNSPQPLRVNVKGDDGNITATFRDRNNPNAPPIASIPTGMPVPPPPSEFQSTANIDGQIVQTRRDGGPPNVLGNAPPAAGMLTADQQQATAWLTDVNATVKGELNAKNSSPNRNPALPKSTALTAAEQNAIVVKVTKGRYKTLGELTAATKRQVGNAGGGSGDDMRSKANRVRQRLEQGDPSRVQGSGLPPGM